jgi:hypothetical protein
MHFEYCQEWLSRFLDNTGVLESWTFEKLGSEPNSNLRIVSLICEVCQFGSTIARKHRKLNVVSTTVCKRDIFFFEYTPINRRTIFKEVRVGTRSCIFKSARIDETWSKRQFRDFRRRMVKDFV